MKRPMLIAVLAVSLVSLAGCAGGGSLFLAAPVIGPDDTKAPTISIKNLEESTTAIPGEPFTVAVTDAGSTLDNVTITYDGSDLVNQEFLAFSVSRRFEIGVPVGTQTLAVTARDAAGNESSTSISFNVIETHHAF